MNEGDGDGGLGWAGKTEVEYAWGTRHRQVFPVRRNPVPCSQTLESRTAGRWGAQTQEHLLERHLIDSVCHNTSGSTNMHTVLPPLAAKFFLAPYRLDGGRPRENFTAAIIPVR